MAVGRKRVTLASNVSRYKNTRLFFDPDTQFEFFGTWRPPKINLNRDPTLHVVRPHQILRPDLIADEVYDNKELWWAIALTNGVFNALTELKGGQVLICPHAEDISAALSSSSETSPGTT